MLSLRSKVTQAVLNYFFLNPHSELYVNQMASLLELDPGNLMKKLTELKHEGIFLSEFRGNQRYYRLNQNYSFLKEYQTIFEKSFGLEPLVKKVFSPIPGIKQLIIFGSYARQQMESESDLDLLVVGKASHFEIAKGALKLQKQIGREVNVVDFSESEFRDRMVKKDSFITEVFKKPHVNVI